MRVALCVKRDIFGVIAARRFLAELGSAAEVDVFCSTKVRPAEGDVPGLRRLAMLERDIPIGMLHPAIAADWAAAPASAVPSRVISPPT